MAVANSADSTSRAAARALPEHFDAGSPVPSAERASDREAAPHSSVGSRHAIFEASLGFVFFLSGGAALLYQICWQRMLFASFGIDIESVTIVVSTFMLGLGAGALAGGWVADRFPTQRILCFAIFELAIGLFGLVSAGAIATAAAMFAAAPRVVVAAVNFGLLLVPTSLMGATLPVLATEATRRHGSVGRSIGRLYFANTMGAAAGAAFLGVGGFAVLGLRDAISLAVALNLFIAASVALMLRSSR